MTPSLKKKKKTLFGQPFIKKIKKLNIKSKKEIIVTWSRVSTIIPTITGYTFTTHNVKEHLPLFITNRMVGHKLGEFVPTLNF